MKDRWLLVFALGLLVSLQASFVGSSGALVARAAPESSNAPSNSTGLGAQVSTIGDAIRNALGYKRTDGVLVTSVVADSPAARAGIEAGNIITQVNGHAVTAPSDLVAITRRLPAGSTVALTVWSAGEERLAVATIGTLPSNVASAPQGSGAESAPTQDTTAAMSPPVPPVSYDLSALPSSSADPVTVLEYYTVKTRGSEVPIGMSLMNQSQQTATVIKFLVEIADPFGKIIESDGFQLSGTFAPNVRIDPRDSRYLSDASTATINANRDIAYNTRPSWIFENRFGPDFYSWQARPVAVRYADGSVWTSSTRYAFVARPTPTPGPTVVVQNNDDCGFFSLFC